MNSTAPTQWLRLSLNKSESIQQQSIILHTHFSMYAHAMEEGHTIALYRHQNFQPIASAHTLYIKSDHASFLESCEENYARNFAIEKLGEDFDPPQGYELSIGQDSPVRKKAS